jgi:hypothetical protein
VTTITITGYIHMFGVAHPDVPVNVTWTTNDCCSGAVTDIIATINGSSYDFGPSTSGQIMPQQLSQVNEKQIARLFGLTLGGLLTAGLVLSAMAL